MGYLLHIETATGVCSVALSRGAELLHIEEHTDSMRHSEIITLQIKKVLDAASLSPSQLAAVSVSEGPGSYTSLRVGTSAAKALCYAHDLPLIAVNTLESLAYASRQYIEGGENYLYCPMIDARRMEVYASVFDADMNTIVDNEPLILEENTFERFVRNGDKIVFSGNGSVKAKTLYKGDEYIYSDIFCSAANLVNIAANKYDEKNFVDLAYFSPNYIKAPNITTPKFKLL